MMAMRNPAEVDAAMRTPRLALTPLSSSYAAALFELLNDWDVVRMLSEVPWPIRYEDVAAFLSSKPSGTNDFVVIGPSGPIGVVAVKRPGTGEPPRKMPRLGYWIGQRHWRRGYGTEAISALVDYAFRTYPADQIGAGVFHDNPASLRLLEKLGFAAMGPGSSLSRSRGGEVETVDMQLTRTAWAERAAAPR